jgi:orotate phosphoribosyltransferase
VNLFQTGDFELAGGARSNFKVECDALVEDDWYTLARIAAVIAGRFCEVEGVARGGYPLESALSRYKSPRHTVMEGRSGLLIVDDVLTTGESMERHRNGREARGVVVFARGACPDWVTPIFQMPV